jgi:hypothetical protein
LGYLRRKWAGWQFALRAVAQPMSGTKRCTDCRGNDTGTANIGATGTTYDTYTDTNGYIAGGDANPPQGQYAGMGRIRYNSAHTVGSGLPCGLKLQQTLTMDCPSASGGGSQYEQHWLYNDLTDTTIHIQREGAAETETYGMSVEQWVSAVMKGARK